jgi:hypothetical protein
VQLFPDRAYRSGRRFLIIAATLSLLVHLFGGAIWSLFRHTMPPGSTPTEADAAAEPITIVQRVPPPPKRSLVRVKPLIARAPKPPVRIPVRPLAVPTYAPVAIAPPRERPVPRVARPVRVAIRVDRPIAPPAPAAPVHAPRGALSTQQLAALNGAFSRTIADAQRAVEQGPPQRASSVGTSRAPSAEERYFDQVMKGDPAEIKAKLFTSGDGECVSIQGPFPHGNMAGYYIRCTIHYSDGFFEQVSFPWPFYFAPHKDPFNFRDNPDGSMHFPGQDPPPGFALQEHFGLSRAVCSYFRPQCAAIIDAERKRGEGSYGTPP